SDDVGRVGRGAADSVGAGAVPGEDAEAAVAQGRGPVVLRADLVGFQQVVVRPIQLDAVGGVTGNQVASDGRVRGAVQQDTVAAVGQFGRPGGVGADAVDQELGADGVLQENAVHLVRPDQVRDDDGVRGSLQMDAAAPVADDRVALAGDRAADLDPG